MGLEFRQFAVPLALLLIALLVYLLIIGKLSGGAFAGSLVGVTVLVAVVAVVLPRSEDVSEVGGKVAGQEILFKMEKVRDEVYAKAAELRRLTERIGEISAFNLSHLFRFAPKNPEAVLLEERDRLAQMLREAGIDGSRVHQITAPVTETIAKDLARHIWGSVPKTIFHEKGKAHGKDLKAVGTKIIDDLMSSPVGEARNSVRPYIDELGGWTTDDEERINEFDDFRKNGILSPRLMSGVEE